MDMGVIHSHLAVIERNNLTRLDYWQQIIYPSSDFVAIKPKYRTILNSYSLILELISIVSFETTLIHFCNLCKD